MPLNWQFDLPHLCASKDYCYLWGCISYLTIKNDISRIKCDRRTIKFIRYLLIYLKLKRYLKDQEYPLCQGNLFKHRGVRDEKQQSKAWTVNTGHRTLYVLKRNPIISTFTSQFSRKQIPGTICGRSKTSCLYLMLSGPQLSFMQVLMVIPVSFFKVKSFGNNYWRLLNIQQAYLLQHWSIYWTYIYLLWDSLRRGRGCILRVYFTSGAQLWCEIYISRVRVLEVQCLVPW